MLHINKYGFWIKRIYSIAMVCTIITLLGFVIIFFGNIVAPNPLFSILGIIIFGSLGIALFAILTSSILATIYRIKTKDRQYDFYMTAGFFLLATFIYYAFFKK